MKKIFRHSFKDNWINKKQKISSAILPNAPKNDNVKVKYLKKWYKKLSETMKLPINFIMI